MEHNKIFFKLKIQYTKEYLKYTQSLLKDSR